MQKASSDARRHGRVPGDRQHKTRVTFMYLGTGSAFGGFVCDLARSTRSIEEIDSAFIVAANRPLSRELARLGVRTLSVPAVEGLNPLSVLSNVLRARSLILDFLQREQPHLVVTLMPHIWSPVLAPAIKLRAGAYVTIIHDAVPHPGDPTGHLTHWLLCDGALADSVVALSRSVAEELAGKRILRGRRIVRLFHPDVTLGSSLANHQLEPGRPLRLLFFGRILTYKGLPLVVEAVEMLKKEGIELALGVAGDGDITSLKDRLVRLGAEVINRWISEAEASELLARYDVMACSHIEASQSGVAALAFGNGMPVVATPIGGLAEQVITGRTGVLAADVTPRAFADAIRQLVAMPGLCDRISRHLSDTRGERSMERFVSELCTRAVRID
jgi:glycosyltransferase involved in cell wall biosynthesis